EFPGFGDFTDNRLRDNPFEFAAIIAESNVDGAPHPSDIDGIQRLGEELKANPERHAELFEQFMNKLNSPNTTAEVVPITSPYESWYIMPDGTLGYDTH